MLSGNIPLVSLDSRDGSDSVAASSMLSSLSGVGVGRGVNFSAHFLRLSFASRTTLPHCDYFMMQTNDDQFYRTVIKGTINETLVN